MFIRNFQKYPAIFTVLFVSVLVLLTHLTDPAMTQIMLSTMLFVGAILSMASIFGLRVEKKYKKLNYGVVVLSLCVSIFLLFNFRNSEVHTELVSVTQTEKDNMNGYGFFNDSISVLPNSNKVILISKNNIGSVYECDINKLEMGDRLEVRQKYTYDIFGTRVNGFKHLKSSTSDTTVPMRYLRN